MSLSVMHGFSKKQPLADVWYVWVGAPTEAAEGWAATVGGAVEGDAHPAHITRDDTPEPHATDGSEQAA